jgi:hypothetical protein
VPLKGAIKGSLGFVADLLGDAGQWCVAVAQLVSSELDSPARQVAHRRFADQSREALRERRTRQTDLTSEIVDCPLLGHAPGRRPRARDTKLSLRPASQPVCSSGSVAT